MDNPALPSLGTWSTLDLPKVPQAPNATIDPILLHFGQFSSETGFEDHGESSNASSPLAHSTTPKRQRRRRKPQSWHRTDQSLVEKKYRDKLRAGWTELSNAISTIRAPTSGPTSDESPPAGLVKPAKNRKKHTVIMKAVEYIKHLENENGILLALLADPLLPEGQFVKRMQSSTNVNDGDCFDDSLIDWIQ